MNVGSFVFIRNVTLMEFIASWFSVITGAWCSQKSSVLAQQKVETFRVALIGTTKLFTGQKQRLYQHGECVCPMRSFPMCPCTERQKEAKQLVTDGTEVYSPLCSMEHNVSLTVPRLI